MLWREPSNWLDVLLKISLFCCLVSFNDIKECPFISSVSMIRSFVLFNFANSFCMMVPELSLAIMVDFACRVASRRTSSSYSGIILSGLRFFRFVENTFAMGSLKYNCLRQHCLGVNIEYSYYLVVLAWAKRFRLR